MVGYVGTIGVGLVLFERKIVYSAFIPATIILAICTYLSMTGLSHMRPYLILQQCVMPKPIHFG